MKDNHSLHDKALIVLNTYKVVGSLLWRIRDKGMDYAVKELQEEVGDNDPFDDMSERVYEGMLATLRLYKKAKGNFKGFKGKDEALFHAVAQFNFKRADK